MTIYPVNSNLDSGTDTLREAIHNAKANPGSTVQLNVTGIILTSQLPLIDVPMIFISTLPNGSVINTSSNQNVFTIDLGNPALEVSFTDIEVNIGGLAINVSDSTLKLSNCFLTDNLNTSGLEGGAILASNSILELSNCSITGNTAGYSGGGINMTGCVAIITNCTIENNISNGTLSAPGGGGGISATNSTLVILQSTINKNSARLNGGGLLLEGCQCLVSNTDISNNICNMVTPENYNGGGIYTSGTSIIIIQCTIQSNFQIDNNSTIHNPYQGGGIYLNDGSTSTINNCIINLNQSVNGGGGIYCNSSNITSTSITNNKTINGKGAGIYKNGDSPNFILNISDSEISGNQSRDQGGGIASFRKSTLNINNCTITDNTSNTANLSISDGSAIYLNRDTKENLCTISFSTISSNNNGSAVYVDATQFNINNCVISQNKNSNNAEKALHIKHGTAIIDTCTVSDNGGPSEAEGYAIYAEDNQNTVLSILNSTISNNINCGGIYMLQISLDLFVNCTIANNSSPSYGGIYLKPVDIAFQYKFINSTIANNQVTDINTAGGLHVTLLTPIILQNTIIAQNLAPTYPDVYGNFTSSANNLIGNGNGASGISDGIDGNLIGVINPLIGSLSNNGGPTQTIPLLIGSPAINAGNNMFVPPSIIYDQRLSPYVRIFNGVVDMGAYEYQSPIICYSGDSLILAKNILSGNICEVKAKHITPNNYHVYDTNTQQFTPVRLNIVTGKVTKFVLLKKNCISRNVPYQDFYVTPGHVLVINGQYIKAKNIKQGVRIVTEPQLVYSICTDKVCTILINGLNVLTWNVRQWKKYINKKHISWYNNHDLV